MSSLLSGCSAAAVINEGFVVASKDEIYELLQGRYCQQQRSLMFLIGQVLYESLIFNIFNKNLMFSL